MTIHSILIAICILFLTYLDASASNTSDYIINHTSKVCLNSLKPCKIYVKESKVVNAYTTCTGEIIFTTALIDLLTIDELKSVAYHEVGHHVLNHCKEAKDFAKNWNGDVQELSKMKHQQELNADMFATKYMSRHLIKNNLIPALLKITKGRETVSSNTHPSTVERINKIKQYQKECRFGLCSNIPLRFIEE